MKGVWRGAILACGFWTLSAQTELPPEVIRLARIKQHMRERLAQVPNYTCLETVERSGRPKASAKFKTLDTLRFEVAEVDGKELFARPGQQFDQTSPGIFSQGGAIASGLFALFANGLFVSDSATHQYAGDEEIGERKLARYDFQVPLLRSGYKIRTPYREAVVAYHGSFWADEELDATHLRIVAEGIPPMMGLLDVGIDIEYQRAKVGATEALLPKRAEMLLTEFSGRQERNVTTFSECRQYGSDSVVSFDTDRAPRPKD